jgi:hypothetical protein
MYTFFLLCFMVKCSCVPGLKGVGFIAKQSKKLLADDEVKQLALIVASKAPHKNYESVCKEILGAYIVAKNEFNAITSDTPISVQALPFVGEIRGISKE